LLQIMPPIISLSEFECQRKRERLLEGSGKFCEGKTQLCSGLDI
jgi:hypothetical protein